jgi:hypothetical protein
MDGWMNEWMTVGNMEWMIWWYASLKAYCYDPNDSDQTQVVGPIQMLCSLFYFIFFASEDFCDNVLVKNWHTPTCKYHPSQRPGTLYLA